MSIDYEFDWDDAKAAANEAKHGVTFLQAMTVLSDALALTVYDAEHSQDEERWLSLGQTSEGSLLVVVHTFVETGPTSALLRIISARPATKNERKQYEQGLAH
jgi:uncharacterized DUF497 family protein